VSYVIATVRDAPRCAFDYSIRAWLFSSLKSNLVKHFLGSDNANRQHSLTSHWTGETWMYERSYLFSAETSSERHSFK